MPPPKLVLSFGRLSIRFPNDPRLQMNGASNRPGIEQASPRHHSEVHVPKIRTLPLKNQCPVPSRNQSSKCSLQLHLRRTASHELSAASWNPDHEVAPQRKRLKSGDESAAPSDGQRALDKPICTPSSVDRSLFCKAKAEAKMVFQKIGARTTKIYSNQHSRTLVGQPTPHYKGLMQALRLHIVFGMLRKEASHTLRVPGLK